MGERVKQLLLVGLEVPKYDFLRIFSMLFDESEILRVCKLPTLHGNNSPVVDYTADCIFVSLYVVFVGYATELRLPGEGYTFLATQLPHSQSKSNHIPNQ